MSLYDFHNFFLGRSGSPGRRISIFGTRFPSSLSGGGYIRPGGMVARMARVSGLSGYLHVAFMETSWKEMYLGITFFSGLFRFICRSGGSIINPAHRFNRTMGITFIDHETPGRFCNCTLVHTALDP